MIERLNSMGRRARVAMVMSALAAFTVLGSGGAAFAAPSADLSGVSDGVEGLVGNLTDLITDNLPYVFVILALTIGVPLIVKFVRRFT